MKERDGYVRLEVYIPVETKQAFRNAFARQFGFETTLDMLQAHDDQSYINFLGIDDWMSETVDRLLRKELGL